MPNAVAISADSQNIYQALRALDPNKVTDKVIASAIEKARKDGRTVDAQTAAVSTRLLHRVASSTTEAEWNDFTQSGQVPPIKLSQEEMELIQGGKWDKSDTWNAIFVALAITSMCL